MLIDEPRLVAKTQDPLLKVLEESMGRKDGNKRLQLGVYEIGHFNAHLLLDDSWLDSFRIEGLSINEYGVCDSVQQILDQCPELQDPKRHFIIAITPVVKAEQSPEGGWRWHKWGPYIGTFDHQFEYLYDEVGIDQVLVYHIHERKPEFVNQ